MVVLYIQQGKESRAWLGCCHEVLAIGMVVDLNISCALLKPGTG